MIGLVLGWGLAILTIDFTLKRKDMREPYTPVANPRPKERLSDEMLIAMGETYFREEYDDDEE